MRQSKPTQSLDCSVQVEHTFRLLADSLCDLSDLAKAPDSRIPFIHDSVDQVLVPQLVRTVLISDLPNVRADRVRTEMVHYMRFEKSRIHRTGKGLAY
jgi:hypothetical protein